MPLSFRFTVAPYPNEPLSGLDLGHLYIANNSLTWSSYGEMPDQSMMVFPSIANLLNGLIVFLKKRNQKQFEWIGIDSSFTLIFSKNLDNKILINLKDNVIACLGEKEFVQLIYQDVTRFLSQKITLLSQDDPVLEDLITAQEKFHIFHRHYEIV